jgi:hypothetical protein
MVPGEGEKGGDGVGGEGGAGGAVEGGGDDGGDLLDAVGEAGGVLEDGVVRADAAGGVGAFELGLSGEVGEVAVDAEEVGVGAGEQRRLGEGVAALDGGGEVAAMAGVEDDAQDGGGDALDGALLLAEHAGGDGGGVERGDGERIAEAGVAAVLEGVEVAGPGARAGAAAPAAGRRRGRRDEVRELVRHDGESLRRRC